VFAPPAFAGDGYHLTANSPAIDRGVSSIITDDIDGQIRPVGAAPDLGADEVMPSALITPKTGGSLVYTGANSLPITILVPPGAIKSSFRLVLEPRLAVTNPPPENFQFAGEAFNLQAFQGETSLPGLSFLVPVTVTIQVDSAKLPSQLAEETLQLFWWNGVDWSQKGVTSATNTIDHTLTASLSHLSEFAMFAQSKPHLFLPIIMRK
jgi:hypothetical protein